jgi:hypothetical protein
LPGFERCERPSTADLRFSGDHPGRLAQGPDENSARAGRMAGLARVFTAMSPILADEQRPVGRAWPAAQTLRFARRSKGKNLSDGRGPLLAERLALGFFARQGGATADREDRPDEDSYQNAPIVGVVDPGVKPVVR